MKCGSLKSLLIFAYALGCAMATMNAANAAEIAKIGILFPGPKGPAPSVDAVVKALGELGYKDGQSATFDIRYAEGKFDQLPALATDLVAQKPNIIVAVAGEALFAAAQATTTIPIVSATGGGDLVKAGLIKSLERPAGNVTGMWLTSDEAAAARVETLKKLMPSMVKLAVLASATYPENEILLSVVQAAAKRLAISVESHTIAKPDEIEGAITAAKSAGAEAIMTLQGPFFFFQRKLIADLALKHKMPLAISEALGGDAGALLQVNPDVPGCAARSATYVDRILKGARPGDLPVERYGNKQLVINLKTAKALGMTIDPSVLQGARVIE
jgi:putative ABC transport system substrate-binding protein